MKPLRKATFAVDDSRCQDDQAVVLLLAEQLGGWRFTLADRFELRFLLKTNRRLASWAVKMLRRLLWHLHHIHPDVRLVIASQCPSRKSS